MRQIYRKNQSVVIYSIWRRRIGEWQLWNEGIPLGMKLLWLWSHNFSEKPSNCLFKMCEFYGRRIIFQWSCYVFFLRIGVRSASMAQVIECLPKCKIHPCHKKKKMELVNFPSNIPLVQVLIKVFNLNIYVILLLINIITSKYM
jgi:hypothetical protein